MNIKKWYVIQVIAGYEERIKKELLRVIHEKAMEEEFGTVLAPEVKVSTLFTNAQETENLFPGYMLIELEPSASAFRIVRTISKVIRFLGGENPLPLTDAEVNRFKAQIQGELTIPTSSHEEFEVGAEIDIKSGVFANFSGKIEAVDRARGKLNVMVSIFGRLTPVEILFEQVK